MAKAQLILLTFSICLSISYLLVDGFVIFQQWVSLIMKIIVGFTLGRWCILKGSVDKEFLFVLRILFIGTLLGYGVYMVSPLPLQVDVGSGHKLFGIHPFPVRLSFDYLGERQLNTVGSLVVPRLSGIFWEPGVLAFYSITYAIIFYNRFRKYSWLAIALVLLTFSTTGYISLILFIWYTGSKNKLKFLLFFALIPIVYLNFSDKVFGAGIASYTQRVFDLQWSLDLLKEYWLFGGYSVRAIDNEIIGGLHFNNTNGIVSVLLKFGIFMGGWVLFQLLKSRAFDKRGFIWILLPFFLGLPILLFPFSFYLISKT